MRLFSTVLISACLSLSVTLHASTPDITSQTRTFLDAFRLGMRDRGYVEGQNLTIDARWMERMAPDEAARLTAELVRWKVDILVGTHRLLSRDVRPKDLGLLMKATMAKVGTRADGKRVSAIAREELGA